MTYVYLDWNVFDRIEKKDSLDKEQCDLYSQIEKMVSDKKIICPYSNAHINDLLRGYYKNPDFIPKHLETLKRLIENLCIVQYWGNSKTTWHYRVANEFFNSALEEIEIIPNSYSELLHFDETGLFDNLLDLMRSTTLPSNFLEIYKADPIFNLIFPRTKTELNMLALCDDLLAFSNNVKKDYSLYKSLRTYFNQSKAKLKSQQKMLKEIDKSISEFPSYLSPDDTWERYATKTKTSENPAFQKIIDTYCKIDFQGYKSDERFSNLIDDAMHVFYGAHCDYFVTIDEKCHYKAAETYHTLGILTRAMKPNEFVNFMTTR